MNILLTGGSGYIGSHTAVELINKGYNVIIFDNLNNSSIEVIDCIYDITGIKPNFYKGDVNDRDALLNVFTRENIDAVIHLAGLKSVTDSAELPIKYYENNVMGTVNLVAVMNEVEVKKLVFSSSASVYGTPENLPITEGAATKPVSVYGKTKLYAEEFMSDVAASDPSWKFIFLRYFNPVGAHESVKIGEKPDGIPNNLAPYITEVILKTRECLSVYGDDYPTHDGTGVRDYIHIKDLAEGHVAAITNIDYQLRGTEVFNLGTGKGASVLEVIKSFEQSLGKKITCKVVKRRVGDVAECFADASKAKAMLGWAAKRSLREMCESALKFATQLESNYVKNRVSKSEK